ncbi:alpha/beta fold hydrolase [Pseudomonas sp. NPDC090201]|jgi:homoserine O-acetyltransferase|uniref:alpha/beta fold hydrolase n=1 Tax=Pseudomonas sp. NPDC090201 TaxID=3364475 RepID=UPI0037FC516F
MNLYRYAGQTLCALLAMSSACVALAAEQQLASIGSLNMVGGKIKQCSLGYRTYGTLAADQSNVVLVPTWLTGRTADQIDLIGPGKLIDTDRWYVVALDAVGNGVSCSPSNSKTHPRLKFPEFGIRDMVKAQHRLLALTLGIDHAHAIVGISMGGMQALQWAVMYPDYASKIVTIVGTPQPTARDLQVWKAEMNAIERNPGWNGGNYAPGTPFKNLAALHTESLWTPEHQAARTVAGKRATEDRLHGTQTSQSFNAVDWYRQLQAMTTFDLVRDGDMATLASKIKARMLIVTSEQDRLVDPAPSKALGRQKRAQLLVLDNDCGHMAPVCEMGKVDEALKTFLK